MRCALSLPLLLISYPATAQLDEEQVERLARMTCEFSNAWTISNLYEQDMLIGGRYTSCYSADLYTVKTSRKGNNEGVSLYFFGKALADSVEARFPPTDQSTYEFIRTRSFVVVISYFTSNGKLYDLYTRDMLKELRLYFINWHMNY